MELNKSLKRRRFEVAITFLSLISTVSVFEYIISGHIETLPIIIELISLTVFIVSFVFTYIKTGLWKFTHKPLNKLDEREIALTSQSLRLSYSLFSIIVLLLLLSFSVLDKPLSIVLVVSLILLAHLLPAMVIAFTQKHIEIE